MSGRRWWSLGLVVLASLVLSACGVPISGAPSALPKSQVPNDLLSPVVPPSTSTTSPAGVSETIYLVNPKQQIVSAQRFVPVPARLTAVLDALLAGPIAQETTQGYTSALTPGIEVLSLVSGPVNVTIDFNSTFGEILGQQQQLLAVAQVVDTVGTYTATPSGVKGVYFEIEGNPTNVPIATGAEVSGPVNSTQYASLSAPSTPGL